MYSRAKTHACIDPQISIFHARVNHIKPSGIVYKFMFMFLSINSLKVLLLAYKLGASFIGED